jgi:hypothetical protein
MFVGIKGNWGLNFLILKFQKSQSVEKNLQMKLIKHLSENFFFTVKNIQGNSKEIG